MALLAAMASRCSKPFLRQAGFVIAAGWCLAVVWWLITPFGAVAGLLLINLARTLFFWRAATMEGGKHAPAAAPLFFLSAGIFLIDAVGSLVWPPFWVRFWSNRLFEVMTLFALAVTGLHLAMQRDAQLGPRLNAALDRLLRVIAPWRRAVAVLRRLLGSRRPG